MNAEKMGREVIAEVVIAIIMVGIIVASVFGLAASRDRSPCYRLGLIKDINLEYETRFHQDVFQSISVDRLRVLLQSNTRSQLVRNTYAVRLEEGKLCSLQNGNELWYMVGQVFQIGYRYEYETGREYRHVETPSIFLRVPPESLLVNWSNAKTNSCFTCGEVAKALKIELTQATKMWEATKRN